MNNHRYLQITFLLGLLVFQSIFQTGISVTDTKLPGTAIEIPTTSSGQPIQPTQDYIIFLDALNYHTIKAEEIQGMYYDNLRAVRLKYEMINQLSDLYEIEVIFSSSEINSLVELPGLVTDSVSDISLADQIDLLRTDLLSKSNFNGSGITVGIIDNGINKTIATLSHTTIDQRDFNEDYPYGSNSHGTYVALSIAGKAANGSLIGSAPGVKLVSARMGSVNTNSIDGDFVGAFDWLIGYPNMSIINTSWGERDQITVEIWDVIMQRLAEKNIFLTGSAGNERLDGYHSFEYKVGGPGSHRYAFSIGSIDRDLSPSYFSSEGPNDRDIMKPDFVTLGNGVLLSQNSIDYFKYSGTSFSSPLFAGALAQLIQSLNHYNISYTADGLKALLADHAQRVSMEKYRVGYGLANFSDAFEYANTTGVIPNIATELDILNDNYRADHLRGSTEMIEFPIYAGDNISHYQSEIEGNLSDLLTYSVSNSILTLNISSSQSNNYGIYLGNITFTNEFNGENYTKNLPISLNMTHELYEKVLIPMDYTDFDHIRHEFSTTKGIMNGSFKTRLSGERISQINLDLRQLGYQLVEYHGKISTINESAIIWFADVKTRDFELYPTPAFEIFDQEDINWLVKRVNGGESVYMTSYARVYQDGTLTDYSADPVLEQVLAAFNIEFTGGTSDASIANNIAGWNEPAINSTRITKNIGQIRHRGGYLGAINPDNASTVGISGWSGAYGSMLYQKNGTLVIGPPIWNTNCALNSPLTDCIEGNGLYAPQNLELTQHLFSYLSSPHDYLDNITYKDNTLHITTHVQTQGIVTVENMVEEDSEQYLIEAGDQVVSVPNIEDGHYEITLESGEDYLRKAITLDNTPPSFQLLAGQSHTFEEGTRDKYVVLYDEPNFGGITITRNSTDFRNFSPNKSNISLTLTYLSPGLHQFNITMLDTKGNSGSITFDLTIIEPSPSSTSESTTDGTNTSPTDTTSKDQISVTTNFRINYPFYGYLALITMCLPILKRSRDDHSDR